MMAQSVTINGVTFPVMTASDFERSKYDYSFGDNQASYDVWGITKDAAQRYWGAGDRTITQGLTSPVNMPGYTYIGGDNGGYVQKDSNPGVAYNGLAVGGWRDSNYWPEFDAQGNLTGMTIKTAGGHGTYVPYKKDASGQFVPDSSGAGLRAYTTNDGDQNRALGTLAAIAGTAGTLGYMNPQWAGVGLEGMGAAQTAAQAGTNYLWPGGQVTAGLSPTGAPAITQLGVPGTMVGGAQNALLPASLAGATAGTGGLAAGGIPVTAGMGLQGSAGLLGPGIGAASGAASTAAGNAVQNAISGASGGGSTLANAGSGLLNWMKDNPGLALTAAGLLGGLAGNAGSQVEDLYGGRKTAIDRLNANKLPAGPWGRY